MKNLWKKVTGITLGAVMALGVGVSVALSADALQASAADVTTNVAVTTFGGSSGTSYVSSAVSSTAYDVNLTAYNFIPNSGQVRGNKSGASENFYMFNTTTKSGYYLKSITMTRGANTGTFTTTSSRTGCAFGSSAYSAPTAFGGQAADSIATGLTSVTWTVANAATNNYGYFQINHVQTSNSVGSVTVAITWGESEAAADVVTQLNVSPSSKSYTLGDAVAADAYTVTATLNGTPDSAYANYRAEIGSLSESVFTKRLDVTFGSTTVTMADNCLRFFAKDATTSGGVEFASADVALTIGYATLESIAVSPESAELVIGGEQQLSVTPTPSNADSSIYSWVSSDDTVASVSSSGLVTALEIGSATITATAAVNHSIVDTMSVSVVDVTSYSLITDLSQLTEGLKVVIGGTKASTSTSYAMSATQTTNNRASVVSTLSGSSLIPGSGYAEFTVGVTTKDEATVYTFHDASGYLYAASSSSNYLRSEASVSDNSKWAITLTGGVFSLTAQGTNTRNIMRFNSSNNPPLFACYSSGQDPVALYGLLGDSQAEQDAAAYATAFISATDSCEVSASGAWAAQKTAFQALSSEAQAILVDATYVSSEYASNSDVQKCAQRYDLAVSRQSLENFMGRTAVSPVSTVQSNPTRQTATSIIIIVVVGAVGLTAIGGYFLFSRKTRKDND